MTHDTYTGGHGPAWLDTGERLSAGEARRLACEAGTIPAVLGGESQVLDLGRTRRLHDKNQRLCLIITQKHCTAEGCDHPPGLCHVHHDIPWSEGGPTNTTHARLLCPRHHTRAHDPRYEMQRLPGNRVRFTLRR